MTEMLETTQDNSYAQDVIHDLEFETPEQEGARMIGEAIVARTINLDMRRSSNFEQSKTPEAFVD